MTQPWKNWANNVSFTPQHFLSPRTETEICQLLQQAAQQGQKVRIVGAGHSFTPLVTTPDLLLDLKHLSGLEHYDPQTGYVTVKAGTCLYDLNQILSHLGRALENLGDINRQTVAGAISTGTHGTGLSLGGLSTQVEALHIIDAQGIVHHIDATTPHQLSAARLSLGTLGIITSITLRTIPAYNLEMDIRASTLNELISLFPEYAARYRHVACFWIPYTNKAQARLLHPSQQPAQQPTKTHFFNDFILENVALWLVSEINKAWPSTTQQVTRFMGSVINNNTRIAASHEIFGNSRLVRFTEMEYAVPFDTLPMVLTELKRMLERHRFPISFPIEIRCAHGDDIMLSTGYQRTNVYIGVHAYQGINNSAYFREAEAIFRAYQGRPHWGKCHHLTAQDFEHIYPRFAEFKAIQKHFDPDERFITPYLRQLLFSSSLE